MLLFFILLGFDLVVLIAHYLFGSSIGFFHIEKEQNLASVYSGAQLIAVGVAGFALAACAYTRPRWERGLWFLLGLGFTYMGADEMAVLHERIGFVLNNQTGLGGYYGESFNWLIYYAPAIIAAVLVFWGVLRMLARDARSLAWCFVTGVAVLFAALGLEVWGGRLLTSSIYPYILVGEEFLEMLGETFVLTAVVLAAHRAFITHYQRRV